MVPPAGIGVNRGGAGVGSPHGHRSTGPQAAHPVDSLRPWRFSGGGYLMSVTSSDSNSSGVLNWTM